MRHARGGSRSGIALGCAGLLASIASGCATSKPEADLTAATADLERAAPVDAAMMSANPGDLASPDSAVPDLSVPDGSSPASDLLGALADLPDAAAMTPGDGAVLDAGFLDAVAGDGSPRDLAQVDLAGADLAWTDLAGPADFAGTPHCPYSDGAGNQNQCFEEGSCDGLARRLQCDGVKCVCLLDGRIVATFAQGNTCRMLDTAWTDNCNF